MLYDEEGKAYVEPPLLPEEQHIHNIVKDYRRMYKQFSRLEGKVLKYRNSLRGMAGLQYAYSRIMLEQIKHTDRLIKLMKESGLYVPDDIRAYHDDLKRKYCKNQ